MGQIQEKGQIRKHHICFIPDPDKPRPLPRRLCIISQEGTLALVTSTSALPSQVDLPIRDHGLPELPPLNPEIRVWNRQMPHSFSGLAMGPRLLHSMALSLLGAGESWSEAYFLLKRGTSSVWVTEGGKSEKGKVS